MAKIHTHYDNLKVARMAPPEVIRAAYKALSQKYHPDKNPGDEKAARIMAILNTAYSTLSDAQRRKEHDEWISAEEWEIAWLESTKGEDTRGERESISRWEDKHEVVPYRPSRDPKWWAVVLGCTGMGWFSAFLMYTQPGFLSAVLPAAPKAAEISVIPAKPPTEFAAPKVPENRVIAISQFRLPDATATCSNDARVALAPNGASWPVQSSYIEGYKVGNLGGSTQLTIDNSHNPVDAFVKLFDIEENQNVRFLLVKARQKFTLEQLKAGNYELRHQPLPALCETQASSAPQASATAASKPAD